ncbi:MAG: heat-inducible transcriptional repressor HrcA [Clostridia bacterium]|nr:heat-inducible transcriptional repressor HrcA [Clostridia bacterium]
MKLDDRKKKILSSVIEDYIVSAEPVGSKTLVDKYHLKYSSATIRNDMKLLEEEGYLEQPHVSAGRIPSTKGYRYYVDNLMKEKNLSMLDINYIDNTITGYGDTEKLLEQAADVVSKILLRPTVLTLKSADLLEHIKIVKISEKLLLVVIMSQNGTVKDCIAKLTDTIPDDKLDELSEVLNKNLLGTPLENLHIALNKVIENELKKFSTILGDISESIRYGLSKETKTLNANVESILDLPEFSDIEKAKNFVNILSTKEIIDSTIDKIKEEKLGIVIGSESKEILLKDYTIVSLNIGEENKPVGKISVIGPKRMDYSKTIATLKYINNKFKNLLPTESKDRREKNE